MNADPTPDELQVLRRLMIDLAAYFRKNLPGGEIDFEIRGRRAEIRRGLMVGWPRRRMSWEILLGVRWEFPFLYYQVGSSIVRPSVVTDLVDLLQYGAPNLHVRKESATN